MAFTRFTKNVLNVSALPDRVQNQAQTLKATFDQAGVDIKTALNALIAELEASTSADNIGADVQSVATKTVQAILTAFEEEIANRYTKVEAETLLAIGTNDLVADIDVNLTTGVITITKKDGTVETFDTAIEKVPAKFEIVQNGDTYALKITNVDGTSTQADITNFMNIYNFNNSDNITFEVTGTGTEKTVTANIKANSIGLDKLSLSVVSTLEGYMTSARDSANAAKTSETNAKTSELSALEAKSSAEKSAEDAEYWAKIAQENGGSGGGGITELPIATTDTLGGIKVGEGLNITEDGVLSAEGGGSSNRNGYAETELLGVPATAVGTYALSESVLNYDEILIEAYITTAQGQPMHKENAKLSPTQIKLDINNEFAITSFIASTSYYNITFGFSADGLSLMLGAINIGTNWSNRTVAISKVTGIKYDVKVLDGAVDVDDTPTEGSENVITSGGVFKAIDSLPYKVLEASTDNVIDFNTLTETGVYLIKNCSDTLGHTINSGLATDADVVNDVILNVLKIVDGSSNNITQTMLRVADITTRSIGIRRWYLNGSWNAWEERRILAAYIAGGTFSGGVYANAEATATVYNAMMRNIKAHTEDLTAGTSTLATGDVYFVYE